ncbi:TRAP transporter large permease [uncultured Sphaerochaeta sp.]|uniref:TRAP transporter large permease n=1 Tax=uncultured Sphaerochaeta sp. TaxID=886478 RepID=UPI002A0A379D|nr:TRAP transporter large permease [uncultured Sphaerochaeta sp.]
MSLTIMFLVLLVLLLLGVPIAYAIGSSGIVYMLLTEPSFLMSFPQRILSGTNNFIIIAMPLFMLTGELMNHCGLTRRLINFALLLVRPFHGGLAEVNIVASMIFGGITGSSVADTSALGSILIPDMIKKGYPRGFAAGVTVASSTMGMIIPPSIPMLMYSMVSGASVGKLFLAGVIPGILVGGSQFIYTFLISKKKHYPQEEGSLPIRETLKIAKDGTLAIFMPILIIVSVSFGIATASESAGIALLYSVLLGFFVYKELKCKAIIKSLKKTAVMTASIMIIGGFTMVFTWALAIEQVPNTIAAFLLASNIPFWVVLILFDILILFLGTFLDVVPCILLIAPILLPVMRQLGMDELQFGMILIVGLAIGLVTPPVGMCLNVGAKISGLSIIEVFKEAVPFLFCNLLILLLVSFIPGISLFLPSLM